MGKGAALLGRATLLGMVGTLVGCLQVLGFQDIEEYGPCKSNEDCPTLEVCGDSDHCEPACAADRDCASGSTCVPDGDRGRCIAVPAVDASVKDAEAAVLPSVDSAAATDVAGEAETRTGRDVLAEAAAPSNDSSADVAVCDSTACASYGLCLPNSTSVACSPANRYGYDSGADGHIPVSPVDLACFELQISACGYLTAIGVVLDAAATNAHVRFGLYQDGGGKPTMRLAETADALVNGSGADLRVLTPVDICEDSKSYWICFGSDMGLDVATVDETMTSWTTIQVAPGSGWVDSGLPDAAPQGTFTAAQPLVYAWVVPHSNVQN